MKNPGWLQPESPFHAGEQAIHARFGIQARMDKQGRRVIRDYMPEQHQQFFGQLPYVIVGTVDQAGQPWASILVGEPGFLSALGDRALQITAQPLFGDPLANTLAEAVDIALLGIELHTRRRNRLNGKVSAIQSNGFTVAVGQSFGNCPQYIQSRRFELAEFDPTFPKPVHSFTTLGNGEQTMIASADTCFITTAYQNDTAGAASGVDVSHRGGKPGFVHLDDPQTLTIPDFSGNYHFNTFGNLAINPRAGLLFMDFDQGNLLYLTGTASVIWEGDEISTYPGAERLLRFQLKRGLLVQGSLPPNWSAPEFSPFLDHTGPWL
jgi:hypothetical protein